MRSWSADHRLLRSARPSRAGFVLVVVLVLIAVAGLSMAGFARRSLELAREAADAQEDLQRRWGTISCQRVVLGQAEDLLNSVVPVSATGEAPWPWLARVEGEFTLGGLRFSVLLSDEDAKVNLNALARSGPNQRRRVSLVARQSAGMAGFEVLARVPESNERNRPEVYFRSWGEVFDLSGRSDRSEGARRLRDATTEITCWGSRRLNLRRASDQAVENVCEGDVPPDVIRKLLTERRALGITKLEDLIARLDLKTKDQMALRRLLSDVSKCHALWLSVQSPRREWVTLSVDRPGPGSAAERETFTW